MPVGAHGAGTVRPPRQSRSMAGMVGWCSGGSPPGVCLGGTTPPSQCSATPRYTRTEPLLIKSTNCVGNTGNGDIFLIARVAHRSKILWIRQSCSRGFLPRLRLSDSGLCVHDRDTPAVWTFNQQFGRSGSLVRDLPRGQAKALLSRVFTRTVALLMIVPPAGLEPATKEL